MMVRNNSRKLQAGFTLIDLLVALVLFSVGILGMVEMQAKMTRVSAESEERTTASLLADKMVADIQMYGGNVAAGVQNSWQSAVVQQLPLGSVAITTSTTVASAVTTTSPPYIGVLPVTPSTTVMVTISWVPPSRTPSSGVLTTQPSQYVTEFAYP